ncbi:MAG TPA: hypothetical protein VHU23_18235 [Rhizomicrobium sp.]|nr:hypothetical protein [Rhizomicrobium sp.]
MEREASAARGTEADNGAEEYERLKQTTAKRLINSVERVDGVSPEEEEAQERGGRLALRGTKRKVERWFWIALFWFGVASAAIAFLALVALTILYFDEMWREGKIEGAVSGILAFIFGAAVTLAAEAMLHRKSHD